MTAPHQRKRDWTAALKRRATREHFIKAGMLPPAFFFSANTEDNARGVVVDAISGVQATLIGGVEFGYNFAPNMHGVAAPPTAVPVIRLPQGAGLAFPGLKKLVAGTNTPVIISSAVKLTGANRADTGGPQYVYRTLVARPFRNLGGTNTAYSGWSVSASDYKYYGYESQYSNRVHLHRAVSPTSEERFTVASPYQSVGIGRPALPGSLLSWSVEVGKTSNTQSAVITGCPRIGYFSASTYTNFIIGDTEDRPLLVGCTRDATTDSYYTEFLDGEIMFLAIWTAESGAVARNASFVGGTEQYGNYFNDSVEMLRRLALAMDSGGGTRPFCRNATHYVSDTEMDGYPVLDDTWETLTKGDRVIVDGTLVEVLLDYPNPQDQTGNYSYQMHNRLVANIPDVYAFKNNKLTVRPLARGSVESPAAAAKGLRLIPGDTVVYKDSHAFRLVDAIYGGAGGNPVTVFMPDTSAETATIRTAGHVVIVGGASSPKVLTLQQLNGKLTAYRMGLGQCGQFSMWNCGVTNMIDCVVKPQRYWTFSSLDQNTLTVDSTYDLIGTTVVLADMFGTTGPIARRSVRMYGGATYGSAGEVAAGSVGSVLRMYGVNSVHRPLDYTVFAFKKIAMLTSANMYAAASKVVRIGGVPAMPGVMPGLYSLGGGFGTRHDPSFSYADNLTPRGSLPAVSAQNYTISGPVTDTYRYASPARRDGLPYSWRMSMSSIEKDPLFYTPFRSRLRTSVSGTALRVHISGVDSANAACLSIRAIYTKAGGTKATAYLRGQDIVLNSISNSLWAGGVALAAYIDIPCPGLQPGSAEVVVGLLAAVGQEPIFHIDPYVQVI